MHRCDQMARLVALRSQSAPLLPHLSECAVPESPPQALGWVRPLLHISSKADVYTGGLACRVRALHLELPVWEPQHGNH